MTGDSPVQRLEKGLRQLGFSDAETLSSRIAEYGRLLLDANLRTNLVGAKDFSELVASHLLDSLAPLVGLELAAPIVDLGSGAGLPGIVAAIAWPQRHFTLFEPRAKRSGFLKEVSQALGLRNLEVVQITAETAGRAAWRGAAGTVLARALAKPPVAFELALPLLRKGGVLVLYRGRAGEPTEAERAIAKRLGGVFVEARRVDVPYLEAERHVWLYRKARPTPADLPRRSGIPAADPLGPEGP